MNQSRLESLLETIVSTVIGMLVAIGMQLLVFPLFGFNPPLHDNLAIAGLFTVASILRGYGVRRLFNFGLRRMLQALSRRLLVFFPKGPHDPS